MRLRIKLPNSVVIGNVVGPKEVETLERIADALALGTMFIIIEPDLGNHLLVNLSRAYWIEHIKDDDEA